MHPGIAIAIGDVKIARRRRHHLGRIVERSSRTGDKVARTFPPSVRVLAPFAQHLQRFAVQGVSETHRIRPIGQIYHVVSNVDAMRISEGPNTPALQVGAVPIEDHHRWVFALEYIDLIARIGGYRASVAERLSWRQLCPIFDQFIPIFTGSDSRHGSDPSPVGCPSSPFPPSPGRLRTGSPQASRFGGRSRR